MSEFNNRIDAQREVLRLVNSIHWSEELFGLSQGAIDRWASINKIDPAAELSATVRDAAAKLFFLANKSQEQVTEEYRFISRQVYELTQRIARIVNATTT
ncbi:conserved protein of unknown function [Cupriavidus taiwanensis]|uniref:Uncharacterized protein n=1 Tax=Cupriavidus taiwanensis TaxID=164546 RepID=A0A375IAD4_9BURK|nr:hypothetical protein [Cupriavidus taiwanensis]SPK71028.1 conserved protein of unknown function [Cupriavidus taiwanensis]